MSNSLPAYLHVFENLVRVEREAAKTLEARSAVLLQAQRDPQDAHRAWEQANDVLSDHIAGMRHAVPDQQGDMLYGDSAAPSTLRAATTKTPIDEAVPRHLRDGDWDAKVPPPPGTQYKPRGFA